MSVLIHSKTPGPLQLHDVTYYEASIRGYSYKPIYKTDSYQVLISGRVPALAMPTKYKVRQDGNVYQLALSRSMNDSKAGKFRIEKMGDNYNILRKYNSGHTALYQLVKTEKGFDACKTPGQDLSSVPGWNDDLERAEAGRAFDAGLFVHQVQEEAGQEREKAMQDDWDLVGVDEVEEDFEMVEAPSVIV